MLICAVIVTRTYHTSLNIVEAVIAAAAAAFIVRSLAAVGDGLSGHFWWYQPPARLKCGFRIHSEYATAPYTWQAAWWDWVPPPPPRSLRWGCFISGGSRGVVYQETFPVRAAISLFLLSSMTSLCHPSTPLIGRQPEDNRRAGHKQ